SHLVLRSEQVGVLDVGQVQAHPELDHGADHASLAGPHPCSVRREFPKVNPVAKPVVSVPTRLPIFDAHVAAKEGLGKRRFTAVIPQHYTRKTIHGASLTS